MQILIRTAQYKYANAGIKMSPFPDQLTRKTELYFKTECHELEDMFKAHVCMFVPKLMVSHLMKFVENCKSCCQVKSVYNLGSWRGDGAMTEIKGDKGR